MGILNFMAGSLVVEKQNEYDELLKKEIKEETVFSCTLYLEQRICIEICACFSSKEIRLDATIFQYKMAQYYFENKKTIAPPELLEDFSREVLIFSSQCVVDASKRCRSVDFFEDIE